MALTAAPTPARARNARWKAGFGQVRNCSYIVPWCGGGRVRASERRLRVGDCERLARRECESACVWPGACGSACSRLPASPLGWPEKIKSRRSMVLGWGRTCVFVRACVCGGATWVVGCWKLVGVFVGSGQRPANGGPRGEFASARMCVCMCASLFERRHIDRRATLQGPGE